MSNERKTVLVSSDSVVGYAEPRLVLEFDGKIYVTLGVLEYDPTSESMDEDARADLAELQSMLNGPRPVSGTVHSQPHTITAMAQSESRNN